MPDTNIKKWSIELDANTEKLRKKLEAGELLKPNEVKKLQNFLKNIIGVAAKDAETIGKKVSAGFKDIDTKGLEDALEFIKGMFKDINKGKNPISDWATEGEKTYKKFSQLEASVAKLEIATTQLGVDIANVNQQMATLNANTEKFVQSYKAINPNKFNGIKKGVTDTVVVTKKLDDVFKSIGKDTSGIDKGSKKLSDYIKLWETATGKKYTFKLSKDVDSQLISLSDKIDDAQYKVTELQKKLSSAPNDTKLQKQFKDAQLELAKLYIQAQDFEEKTWGDIGEDFGLELKKIQKELTEILGNFSKKLEQVIDKMSTIKIDLGLPEYSDFANKINNFIDGINAGKGGALKEVNLTAKIANVKDVQSSGIDVDTKPEKKTKSAEKSPTSKRLEDEIAKLQKQISDKNTQLNELKAKQAADDANDKQKAGFQTQIDRVNKEIKALEGSVADYQYLIKEIESNPGSGLANEVRRWQTTEANIGRTQDRILQKTKEWKNEIVEAMTVSSQELTFEYGWDNSVTVGVQNLQSALERYFADSPVNITINTDSIGEQIKTAIEEKGITLSGGGGGTAQLNSQEVVDMIMSLLTGATVSTQVEKAVTEEKQEIVHKEIEATNTANNATKQTTQNTVRYAAALNKLNINFTDIIGVITEFANETINTKKPAKGGKKVSSQLAAWGFDFKKIAKGEFSEADFVNMLQKAMMTVNSDGGVQGARIINYLDDVLTDRKNNLDKTTGMGAVINRLKEQLQELLKLSGVNVEHVLAEQRRYERFDTYNSVKDAGRKLGYLQQIGYTSIYSDVKNRNIPEIEKIEKVQNKLKEDGKSNHIINDLLELTKNLNDRGMYDQATIDDYWNTVDFMFEKPRKAYEKLFGQVKNFQFVIETDKGTKETNGGSGYLSIPEDANIKEVQIYPTKSYLNTHRGEELPALFNDKRKPPKQNILNEDIGDVAPFKAIEREDGGIRGGDKGVEILRKTAAKAPELAQKTSELEAKIQDLTNTIGQLQKDLGRLTLTEKTSVSLKSLADVNTEIAKIESELKTLQNDLSTELAKTSSYTKQIQEIEKYKSYSKDELSAIEKDASDKIGQRRALDAFESLRNSQNPTKDAIFSARQAMSVLGDDTLNEALESLYSERLHLDEILNDENVSTKRKNTAQKLFDQKFNNFIAMINEDAFDVLFKQAKDVNLQSETERQKRAHTAYWEPQKLDAEIDDINKKVAVSEKEQSKIQSKIDETNKKLTKTKGKQTKEIAAVSNTFKEVKNTLYKEAEGYVKLLQTLDPKSEGYETALAKLQQTIRAIQSTQSVFETFKKSTGKTRSKLFNKNETKAIDSWTAQFVTNKPDILSDTQTLLVDRENDLNAAKTERLNTENALKDATNKQNTLSVAEKEIAFAKEYNRLLAEEEQHLANIAKLKKQGANQDDIRAEQEALNATREELNSFLADNKDNDRHLYALDEAKKYTLQMYKANKQYYVAEKELNKIKKEEADLSRYPLFTQGAGRYELDDYKTELANKRAKEFEDAEYARLREKWGGKRRRDISDEDLADYDADYQQLDDDVKEQRKQYKDSLKAVVIDGITQLATMTTKTVNGVSEEVVNEVVDKNLKTTLAKRLKIDSRKENAQDIYDSRKDLVSRLASEKSKAMRYGQVTDTEVDNDKLVRQQKEYIDKLFALQEQEKQLIAERDRLDNETKSYRDKKKDEMSPEEAEKVKNFKDTGKELERVQEQIDDYTTRVENYEAVINQKPEYTKQEKDATVELNKATEKLTHDKAELAKVQTEITELEEKYNAIADGTPEKEAALAELERKRNYAEKLDASVKKGRLSATYWAGQADKTETQPKTSTPTAASTETTTIKGGLFGALADSIINGVREGFSGLSLDPRQSGIATEITLRAIFDLLSGGGAYGEELDRKHAAWQAGHPVVQQPSRSVETTDKEEKQEEKPKKISKTQQQMVRLSEEGQQVWKDIADAAKKTKEEIEGLKKSALTNKMSKLAQEISTESDVAVKLKKQAQLTEMFYAYKGKDDNFDDTVKKVTALKAFQGITDFEKMLLRDYKARGDALVKAGYGVGEKKGDLGRETNPKADYKVAVDIVSQALKDAGYNGNIKNPEKLAAIWDKLDNEKVRNAGNYLAKGQKDGIETVKGKALLDAMLKLKDAATKLQPPKAKTTTEQVGISDEVKAQILALLPDIKAEIDEIKAEMAKTGSDPEKESRLASLTQKENQITQLLGQKAEEQSAVDEIEDEVQTPQTTTAQGGLPAWIQGITSAVQGLDTGTLASMLGIQKQILEGVNIISRRNSAGRPNGATDLYEDFRRMLESDKWEGRERARYMDYQTGAISNHITGTDKELTGTALDRLYENYTKSMTINTQLHSHAGFNEPYFSSKDLSTFVDSKKNKGISKQILMSDKNITLLDLSEVADNKLQELVNTLTNTENDFDKLGEVAKKYGARYETLAFDDFEKDITPQKLTKFLGIKGVESKLNATETKDAAIQGVAEEAAKEAAHVVQKSTGAAIKTTFERAGLEMIKSIEQTDAKGNKTWSTDASNKYQKHIEATHKDIVGQNLGDVFGKGTDAQKALVEYEKHYTKLNELVEQFKTADESSKAGIQAKINELIPSLNKAEKELIGLIARKDKFLGDDKALDTTFGAKELASPRKNLEKLARQMYGGNVNPGGNVAFGGYKRGQGSGQLFVDVLDGQTKTIKTHVLEVDKATGKVKEYTLAENALSNAFQNVNRAMKQNEFVLADVAMGDGPKKQAEWMANASSPLLDAYKNTFSEMQNYTAQLWNSGKAPSQQQLDYLMQLSERVMVLGKELQKTSGDFKNFWAQNPDAVRGIDFHEGDTIRTAMERYAQTNANANTSKYEFASFDNNTLKYKLTDVEGNVRNVSMVWDELYQKVAVVSDKSVVALDPLVAKIEKYKQTVSDAKASEYLLDTDDAGFNVALQEVEALQQKVKEGTATYEELEAARRRAIKEGSDAEKLAKKNEKLYAGTNELRSAERQNTKIIGTLPETFNKETSEQFQAYKKAYDDLITKHKDFAKDRKLASTDAQKELQREAAAVQKLGKQFLASANEAEKLQEAVDNSGSFVNKQGKEIKLGDVKTVSPEEMNNLNVAMRAYAQEVLGAELAHAKFNPTTQQLTGVIRQNNRVVSDMVVKYNEATGQMYLFQKQERESLSGLPGLLHGLKEKSKAIVQYLASMTSIYRVFSTLRQGLTYVKEIDLALTELKKVTDETEATYDKFLDTAAETGARLGTPISAVIEATATFAKLGYTMREASEMAEAAIVYKNVGDGIASTEDAADSIISTLKGFGMEASETMRIVDRFNEVGNRFAITSKGIGEALRLSASALNEGGNSLDESIALITAANEVVNDPSSVGTALKTLTLRLRGSKTELEEMGEDVTDMAKTTSQLQAKLLALTGGKVDIMLDSNTFKNSTQILREMADAWKGMNDIQRASALELMGGKRQANVLSALIQNFDTAEDVIEASANSAGSALKENEKYLDSIQGKIDQFTNAVQTMWKNVLDDDVVKFFVELATKLVKILDKLGPIETLIAGIMTYVTKKNGIDIFSLIPKNADKAKKKITELKTEIAQLEGLESQKNLEKKDALTQQLRTLEAQTAPSQELVAAQDKLTKAQNRLANTKSVNPKTIAKYKNEVKKAQLQVDNLTTAQNKTGKSGNVAFAKLDKSVKNFAKSIGTALIQMAAMWAIMKLLELGKELIDYLIETPEEAAEKFEELTNELKNTKSELEGINDELKTLDDQIAELTAKEKLSFTEQEELERLKEERAELERELELKKALAQQQQEQVNSQTSDQVKYYKNKGTKTGKTAGENVGSGAATGAGVGAATGAAIGTAILPGIGTLIGALIGAVGGAAVGAGVGGIIAATESTIGEEIDNMEANLAAKEQTAELMRAKYQASGSNFDKAQYEQAQQALSDYRGEMAKYFTELDAYYDNVDLSEVENPDRYKELKKEMNDFYNERDKWLITSGSEGATSNAIERVFDKKENKKAKEDIESLMEQLKEDPGNTAIEQKIKNIINGSTTLKADFKAIGIEVDDVARSFTQMAEEQLFGTVDGKIEELERATTAFKSLLNGGRFNFEGKNIGLADLFTDEGEVVQTKLSEIFKNTSSETREAITGLLERSYDDIQDGTINIETLLGEFASRGSEAILGILEETSDTFEEISENMDKIQDSYSTLSNAVEQYNSAGFLTLDNLQSLLSLEPEYLALLQMENGQLTINQAGYEALIQTKLAEAKASVVQSAMKQLNALAAKSEADATNAASTAAANSISNLGTYANALSDVAKNAIGAASSVYAFNNAVAGAQANELVKQEEIDAIINSMDTQLQMIDSVGANLSTNFSGIMTGGEGGNPKDGGEDSDEWEKLLKKHQAELDAITHEKDLVQAEIDKAEAKGFIASEEHYERLIALEQEEKNALIAKQQAMQDFYNINAASMSTDEIDEWNAEMRETALAIKEAETNMIEFGNTIREIGEEYFGKISEDIDAINEEIEFMHGLLEDEPVADENGNWSNEALTRLGLYTQQMEKAAFETQRAKDELAELQVTTSEADKNTDWYREREEELTQAIYDGTNAYNDYKDGIVELNEARVEAIKEGIEKEIEAYNDLIENKKEALDAERDLYDFKKNIEKQNKSIADTERKLAALSGSTAAEDIAERKRLEAELREQQGNLDDTYYDHSMTAQQNALDEEGRYFEEAQNRRIESLEAMLENTEELIVNSMMDVMLNADTVHQTLNEQANTYGVTLSEELTKPWLDASAQAIAWRDELKRDMTEGEWAAMIGEGGAITAFSNGVATKLGGSWDTIKTKTKAYADFLTGTELKNDFSGAVTTFITYLQKIVDKWNAIRNAAVAATSVTPTVPSGGTGGGGDGGNPTPSPSPAPAPKETPKAKTMHADGQLFARTVVPTNLTSTHKTVGGVTYVPIPGTDYYVKKSDAPFGSAPYGTKKYKYYAKGTLGVDENQWAITDEYGPELTMYATKDGTLSFMRAGSTVIPAELTKELMDIGAVGLNGLMKPKFDSGMNIINNAINKPEYNFSFDALVKAEKVTEETMPALQKMVTQELDKFAKKLQYSIKGIGGR